MIFVFDALPSMGSCIKLFTTISHNFCRRFENIEELRSYEIPRHWKTCQEPSPPLKMNGDRPKENYWNKITWIKKDISYFNERRIAGNEQKYHFEPTVAVFRVFYFRTNVSRPQVPKSKRENPTEPTFTYFEKCCRKDLMKISKLFKIYEQVKYWTFLNCSYLMNWAGSGRAGL